MNKQLNPNEQQPSFKILIVDDVQHNLFTLHTLIDKHLNLRVQIIEATSGKQALEIALDQSLDLIILDIQMPEMDGFQTASMLKIRKKTKDIPIIFLTAAYKSTEFQLKGYDVGAVDYLVKPIDDNQLINKISTYIKLIENERNLNVILEAKVQERTEALNRANRYMESILLFMGEALIVLKKDGKIEYVNPTACELLGYDQDALIGDSIGDIFEEEDQEKATAFMGTWLEAIIRSGVITNVDASFIAKDGTRIPILFSRTALQDEQGELSGIICIAKNMTGYQKI